MRAQATKTTQMVPQMDAILGDAYDALEIARVKLTRLRDGVRGPKAEMAYDAAESSIADAMSALHEFLPPSRTRRKIGR